MDMVNVKNLNVIFGKKHIVHDVSFTVKKGEIIGLFGISGAGKTTIIRVLTCQIDKKNWNGEVLVTGLSPSKKSNHPKILSNIGYVPQLEELNLYYELSPMVNVEVFTSTYGMDVKKAKEVDADIIAISALLSTSLPYVKDVIKLLKELGLRDKYVIMIGGGAVTREWAQEVGADGYGENADEAVKIAIELMKKKKTSQ